MKNRTALINQIRGLALEYGIDMREGAHKGNCLDNAVTERFFRSLKAERVDYRRYEIRSQGIADVIDDIDNFYNLKRQHYMLGNISPDEYERRL
ncbi:hypothetical protein BHG07_05230 [Brenneria salicis ATCC 15712 = DSM 30166]|nr:hypothetical protein BHG07_05230 [Brenneria salicis ATCC 15712 = DSM 30166]